MRATAPGRLAIPAAVFLLSLLSCGREVTGPENGVFSGGRRVGALAVAPEYPSLMASVLGGSQVVPFERVRLVLRRTDGAVALDTLIAFPATVDSLTLAFLVPLPVNAPAEGVSMALTMAYINAAGDTVFRAGPQSVLVPPVRDGVTQPPVSTPIRYSGVGAGAASVQISPDTATRVAGSSSGFTATALDGQSQPIAGTPLLFYTLDSTRATVTNASTGATTWLPSRGTARIVAALPDGSRADTASISVTLPASQLVLGSGDLQTAPLGNPLGAPIVLRTLASDAVPVAGVIVNFAVSTGGGSLTVTTDTSDTNGEVSTGWTLGSAFGVQTITATAAGLSGSPLVISASASAGAPAQLAVVSQPVAGVAGETLAPAIVIAVEDEQGNLVETFTGAVTLALPPAADATLGGTTTVNAVAGLATFNDLSLDIVGAYGLIATSGSLTPDTTAAITVTAAAAARLTFITWPSGGVAGTTLAPTTTVRALDAFGNDATGFTGNISLQLLDGTGTLGGTTSVAAVAGVATFADLSVDLIGDAYTLRAFSGALQPDTTTAFTITPAAVAGLTLLGGDGQTAVAATLLPDVIAVRTVDAFGNRVPGAGVTFSILTGGGGVVPPTTTADTSGRAVANWTLGATLGTQTLRVSLTGVPAVTLDVSATATVGPASQLVVTQQPADTVEAGATIPILVEARDALGNLVPTYVGTANITLLVNPTLTTLGGTTSAAFIGGVASLAPTISASSAGYQFELNAGALSNATSSVFVVGAAAAATFEIVSGTPQSGQVGTAFPTPMVVRVLDGFGNPLPGHTTTWTPLAGASAVDAVTVLTDAAGEAQNGATFGTTAGDGQPGVGVTTAGLATVLQFDVDVAPGAPASIVLVDGNTQTETVDLPLPTPLSVRVTDGFGNGIAGVTVLWGVSAGQGQFTDTTSTTDAAGVASTVAILGTVAGAVQFEALVDGVAGSPVLFDATATPDIPVVVQALTGDEQTATAGAAYANPFVVRVEDIHGNPVPGVSVTFDVQTGAASFSDTTVVTDGNGEAQTTAVASSTAGAGTIGADAAGATPATFNVTITAATAFSLEYLLGDAQQDTVGVELADSLRVLVRDSFGNPVPNVSVDWAATGGSVSAATALTSASGEAAIAYTLGTVAGAQSATASVAGLSGSPVPFTMTAIAGAPSALVVVSTPDTVVSGVVPPPLEVEARDIHGNLVTWFVDDVTVTPTDAPDGAFTAGTTTRAAVGGVASFDDLVFGTPGPWLIEFASGDLTIGASLEVIPGPPASFTIESGNGQAGPTSALLPAPLVVRLLDVLTNPVVGDTVIFTVTSGAGLLGSGFAVDTALTDANGDAQVTWTLGPDTLATHTVEAAYPGFTALVFTATPLPNVANRSWTGDALNGAWFDTGNWAGGVIPAATDSVLIPAGRPSYPDFGDLSGSDVTIGGLTVRSGANIAMDIGDLYVGGNVTVESPGGITSPGGRVIANGAGAHSIRGNIPLVVIADGGYALNGALITTLDLSITGGVLDVGLWTLGVGRDLFTSGVGALVMPAFSDVQVTRNASLQGDGSAGRLQGGTMTVQGDFSAGTTFAAAVDHTVNLVGVGLQTVTITDADTTYSATCSAACFGRLTSLKGIGDGGLVFASHAKAINGMQISGDTIGASGHTLIGAVTMDLNTTVVSAQRVAYSDNLLLGSTRIVDTLVAFNAGTPWPVVSVDAIPTLVAGARELNAVHSGAIIVGAGGALDIVGATEVGAGFYTRDNGVLQMSDAADTLVVAGSVEFAGGPSLLTNGALIVQGDFAQHTNADAFRAAPAHETVFAGNASFTVTFANPGFAPTESQFGTFVFEHPISSSMDIGSDIYASGALETRGNNPYWINGSNNRLLTRGAINVADVTFAAVQWELQDTQPVVGALFNLVFSGMDPAISQMRILRAGGTILLQSPTFDPVLSGGAYLEVEDGNPGDLDTLTVAISNPAPQLHGGGIIEANGARITGWPGFAEIVWNGSVSVDWFDPDNWVQGVVPTAADSVVIPQVATMPTISAPATVRVLLHQANPGVVGVNDVLTILERVSAGSDGAGLQCGPAGRIVFAPTDTLLFTGDLLGCDVRVTSGVAAPAGYSSVGDSLEITGTAQLDLRNQELFVSGDLVTDQQGTLRMTDPAATLYANGGAFFHGGSTAGLLTAGTIFLSGEFQQLATYSAEAFAADPGHLTQLTASVLQPNFFATPELGAGSSHFGDLQLETPEWYLQSPTAVSGSLIQPVGGPNAVVSSASSQVLAVQGLSVERDLTFRGVHLQIAGAAPMTLTGNLTFEQMVGTMPQLDLERAGDTLTVGILTFDTTASHTGPFVDVQDISVDGDSLTLLASAITPLYHGGRLAVLGEGRVPGWDAAEPGAFTPNYWTGGGADGLWATAANWSEGRAPLAMDSVVINPGGPVTVTLDANADVAYLHVGESSAVEFLHTAGFVLQIDSLSFFGTTSTLRIGGGAELTGDGSLVVFGNLDWQDGWMTGFGSTSVAAGGTATLGSVDDIVLDDRVLLIGGTATMGSAQLFVENFPTLYVMAGGELTIPDTRTLTVGTGDPSLYVDGTLRIAGAPADTVQIHWFTTIGLDGVLDVQSGTLIMVSPSLLYDTNIADGAALNLRGAAESYGTMSVSTGGRLQLESGGLGPDTGIHAFYGSLTGTGAVHAVNAVSVNVEAGMDIDSLVVQNVTMEFNSPVDTMFVGRGVYLGGGVFSGTGVVGVRESFVGQIGNMDGSGTLAVLSGATASLQGPVRGWLLDVAGTLEWGDWNLTFSTDPSSGQYTSMLVRSGGVFDILHGATARDLSGTGTDTAPDANVIQVLAGGTIRKSSGTGTSTIHARVEMAGTFEFVSGTINVQGTCDNPIPSATGSGTLSGNCGAYP